MPWRGPLSSAAWSGRRYFPGSFSADPLADITHQTGDWTLRFLVITLALTPLRRVTGWNFLIRFRRMTGLYAFFYGSLHLLIYLIADRYASLDLPNGIFAWQSARAFAASVWSDIAKRPFITVGFTAWTCMLPLALTSTAGMIRRLGGKRWNQLHTLIYVSAVAGVVHYWWLVKADVHRPEAYAAVVFTLLAFRVAWKSRLEARPRRRLPRGQRKLDVAAAQDDADALSRESEASRAAPLRPPSAPVGSTDELSCRSHRKNIVSTSSAASSTVVMSR